MGAETATTMVTVVMTAMTLTAVVTAVAVLGGTCHLPLLSPLPVLPAALRTSPPRCLVSPFPGPPWSPLSSRLLAQLSYFSGWQSRLLVAHPLSSFVTPTGLSSYSLCLCKHTRFWVPCHLVVSKEET